MDIIDFSEKFFRIEKETTLLEDSQCGNVNIWDLVRHDLFYYIFLSQENISVQPKSNSILTFKKKFKDLFNFIRKAKKRKIIIIAASRVKYNEYYVDPISDSLLKKYNTSECLIYESYSDWELTSKQCSNEPLKHLIRKTVSLFPLSRKEDKIVEAIITHIKLEFDLIIHKRFFKERITQFRADYHYYLSLFKILKPEKIFVVQNGIMKGLFKAAKNLDIKTYELQHGFVGKTHPAYHYDLDYNKLNRFIFPDYFLTFGSYWNSCCCYPPEKIIIGKEGNQIEKSAEKNKNYDVTLFSSEFHNKYLIPLAIELVTLKPNLKICFKFHPNQKRNEIEFRNSLIKYNITVFFDEIDSSILVKESIYSLIIQSSIGFEVINEGKCLLIYEKLNYQENLDILSLPHTKTFKTVQELIRILGSKIPYNLEINKFYSNIDIEQYP